MGAVTVIVPVATLQVGCVKVAVGVDGVVQSASPIAKSLNVVNLVACVLVEVRVPTVGLVHVAPVNLPIIKVAVFGLPTRSPATKLNVGL